MGWVLLKRWNLSVGIPDSWMLIGDEAFTECMRRFFTMPMFVMASKVCPEGVEGTLFAMLMALSNFGASIGQFLGTTLLEALDVQNCYDVGGGDRIGCPNLDEVVLLKSFCRCLP